MARPLSRLSPRASARLSTWASLPPSSAGLACWRTPAISAWRGTGRRRLVSEALQQRKPFRGGQHRKRELEQPGDRVEGLDDLLTATRNHVRILSETPDTSGAQQPALWINAEL
jgi:hypothetical protein